mmetsp:Transcript_125551/g.351616  ORF Transcript_125551/g.351616 Transcript_125551/m.351616 type:complete len:288 (+) Transcript_125551:70-933(+)
MAARGALAAALALVGPSVAAALSAKRGPDVKPALDPESHKEFFGHDYPKDDHPTPQQGHDTLPIQEDDVYDKDYVKDENGEGEAWRREAEYEFLVKKMASARAGAKDAEAKEEETRKDLDGAKADEEAARKAKDDRVSEAEEKYRIAVAEAEEAVRHAQEAYDAALKKGPHGVGVAEAEKDLAEQKKKCEALEKLLDAATARLEELLAQETQALAEVKQTSEAQQAAMQLEAEKTKERDAAVAKYDKESKDFAKAHAKYVMNMKLLNKTKVDLKDAEAKLRGFRKTV